MSTKPVVDNVLLVSVLKSIGDNFSKEKAENLKLFVRQYFASTARSELAKYSEQEIYAATLEAWKFIQERKSSMPKIQFSQQIIKSHCDIYIRETLLF